MPSHIDVPLPKVKNTSRILSGHKFGDFGFCCIPMRQSMGVTTCNKLEALYKQVISIPSDYFLLGLLLIAHDSRLRTKI